MSCETCKDHKEVAPVPYIVHESAMARNERNMKRVVIALVIAIIAILVSHAAWLYAWMQYDYSGTETVYTQDGEGLNITGDRNTAQIDGPERND